VITIVTDIGGHLTHVIGFENLSFGVASYCSCWLVYRRLDIIMMSIQYLCTRFGSSLDLQSLPVLDTAVKLMRRCRACNRFNERYAGSRECGTVGRARAMARAVINIVTPLFRLLSPAP